MDQRTLERPRPAMHYTIRPLRGSDAPAWLELRQAMADDPSTGEPAGIRSTERALTIGMIKSEIKAHRAFGAFGAFAAGDELVGAACIEIVRDLATEYFARFAGVPAEFMLGLRAVGVLASARRQGIAEALVTRCIRYARGRGAVSLLLDVRIWEQTRFSRGSGTVFSRLSR